MLRKRRISWVDLSKPLRNENNEIGLEFGAKAIFDISLKWNFHYEVYD